MISMSELSDAWKAIAPQEGQTVSGLSDNFCSTSLEKPHASQR